LGKFLLNPTVRLIKERARKINDLFAEAERNRKDAEKLREFLERKLGEAERKAEEIIREGGP